MIRSLQFRSGYPLDLDGIGAEKIEFSDRINLLIGPNGAGKSTVLYALAGLTGCAEGGWSAENPSDGGGSDTPQTPHAPNAIYTPNALYTAEIDWDGWPVFFQDCYRDSDNSFIDTDYLERKEVLRSTGEKRIGLINELIDELEERFPTFKLRRNQRPTLILDEIDNHVGFAGQSILWKDIVPKLSKKYQLIVSSHSIFPILLRQQNLTRSDRLIELSPGYLAICLNELNGAVQYFNTQGDGARNDADSEKAAKRPDDDAEAPAPEGPDAPSERGMPGI